jgi:hypothetical protein
VGSDPLTVLHEQSFDRARGGAASQILCSKKEETQA